MNNRLTGFLGNKLLNLGLLLIVLFIVIFVAAWSENNKKQDNQMSTNNTKMQNGSGIILDPEKLPNGLAISE